MECADFLRLKTCAHFWHQRAELVSLEPHGSPNGFPDEKRTGGRKDIGKVTTKSTTNHQLPSCDLIGSRVSSIKIK